MRLRKQHDDVVQIRLLCIVSVYPSYRNRISVNSRVLLNAVIEREARQPPNYFFGHESKLGQYYEKNASPK